MYSDFHSIKSILLAYPEKMSDPEYVRLTSFFDELIELIPEEIEINLIIQNQKIGERIKVKRSKGDVKTIIIPGFNEIWLRDLIGFNLGEVIIKPIFKPTIGTRKYTENDLDNLNKQIKKIIKHIGKDVKDLPLVLDGGNLVSNGKLGISTDKIIMDNPGKDVYQLIYDYLGIHSVIVPSPNSKYDKLAHTDGYMAFLDENTILLSDYPSDMNSLKADRHYLSTLKAILKANGLKVVPFSDRPVLRGPRSILEEPEEKYYGAEGIYINFLQLNNHVLVPQYKTDTLYDIKIYNSKAREFFSSRKFNPIPILCENLAKLGGVLHCISFTF